MQYKNPLRLIGAGLMLGALALPSSAQNNAPATGTAPTTGTMSGGTMSTDMSNMMYGSYNTGLASTDQQSLMQALGGLSLSDQVMLREKMYEMLPSQNRVLLQALSAPGAIQDGKVQWGAIAAATMPTATMPGGPAMTSIMEPRFAPTNKMQPGDTSTPNKMSGTMSDNAMSNSGMSNSGMANSDMNNGSKRHRRRRRHGKTQDDTTQTTTSQTDTTQGTAPTTGTTTPGAAQ